jgi:hypothetical protein
MNVKQSEQKLRLLRAGFNIVAFYYLWLNIDEILFKTSVCDCVMIIMKWDLCYQCNVIGARTVDGKVLICVSYFYYECAYIILLGLKMEQLCVYLQFTCHYHKMHFTAQHLGIMAVLQPYMLYVTSKCCMYFSCGI